ncbi:hypothetical protein [Nostoc sp. FACHB-145]|uniref:hypothetical protein n=1 Tax=Nostoc sp. FACHB-145 TaxID=2692836 RepID=UPI00168A3AFE|nr:hypothetical protein [Nostoc sp. FACHB-145]MBD2470761.1 hypothetical protein [Nostoc sp. FACHB-145]
MNPRIFLLCSLLPCLFGQQLELYLGVYEGKLRYFTTDNQSIPTPEEKAIEEQTRAQQAEARAN